MPTHLRPDLEDPSTGEAGTSGELQDPGESSTRLSEAAAAKAKLRDKNKRAQKRFRERKKVSSPGLDTVPIIDSYHKAFTNAQLA